MGRREGIVECSEARCSIPIRHSRFLGSEPAGMARPETRLWRASWVAVGLVDGIEIVAYTMRGDVIRLISQERLSDMSVKTTGTVKFTLDPKRPSALSKKARARLVAKTDRDIGLTDLPATHGVAWTRPGLLIAGENKRQITLRIDADILDFFRTTGRRYQTRMNAVLRSSMNAQRQSVSSHRTK